MSSLSSTNKKMKSLIEDMIYKPCDYHITTSGCTGWVNRPGLQKDTNQSESNDRSIRTEICIECHLFPRNSSYRTITLFVAWTVTINRYCRFTFVRRTPFYRVYYSDKHWPKFTDQRKIPQWTDSLHKPLWGGEWALRGMVFRVF